MRPTSLKQCAHEKMARQLSEGQKVWDTTQIQNIWILNKGRPYYVLLARAYKGVGAKNDTAMFVTSVMYVTIIE